MWQWEHILTLAQSIVHRGLLGCHAVRTCARVLRGKEDNKLLNDLRIPLCVCVWLCRGWSWPQLGLLFPPFCPFWHVPALFHAWSLSLRGESVQGSQLTKTWWWRGDWSSTCSAAKLINAAWPCRGVEDSAGKGKSALKADGTAAVSVLVRLNPSNLCPEGRKSHLLFLCHQKSWSPCFLYDLCTVLLLFPLCWLWHISDPVLSQQKTILSKKKKATVLLWI